MQRLLQIIPKPWRRATSRNLCELLIAGGDVGTARTIVEAFLKHSPDNVTALFYRGLLAEPDPRNCPPARRQELQEQAARAVADPVRRSLNLGLFYEQTQQWDKAMAQWRSVLDATAAQARGGHAGLCRPPSR